MSLITHPNARRLHASVRASAMVFEDPASRRLLARLQRLAPSEASLLITGETGTGKELVARHVHALSARGGGHFVAVNCGALPDSLVESELFGHERGAFTGASEARPGWFEAAEGGTLFLDELGDLPLSTQVKLLRVLQEREVVRLGARRPRAVDVRVIAATHVDLEQAVVAGRFRQDLFYRLRVAEVRLLPLRERRADILPLAEHFLQDYCTRLGYAAAVLDPVARQVLAEHDWPGNIRELENVIHYALLVCRDGVIRREDLQCRTHRPSAPAVGPEAESGGTREGSQGGGGGSAEAGGCTGPASAAALLDAALEQLFEQAGADLYQRIDDQVVRSAWVYCHRNQVHAARLLGISRNVLRGKLLRMGEIGGAVMR